MRLQLNRTKVHFWWAQLQQIIYAEHVIFPWQLSCVLCTLNSRKIIMDFSVNFNAVKTFRPTTQKCFGKCLEPIAKIENACASHREKTAIKNEPTKYDTKIKRENNWCQRKFDNAMEKKWMFPFFTLTLFTSMRNVRVTDIYVKLHFRIFYRPKMFIFARSSAMTFALLGFRVYLFFRWTSTLRSTLLLFIYIFYGYLPRVRYFAQSISIINWKYCYLFFFGFSSLLTNQTRWR